jgi:hypothetical protein
MPDHPLHGKVFTRIEIALNLLFTAQQATLAKNLIFATTVQRKTFGETKTLLVITKQFCTQCNLTGFALRC